MANKEHLEILQQGVDVWNKWREENPGVKPDLIGINLPHANFFGANFLGANLSRAKLVGAHFLGANLSGANLFDAYLENAYLENADLSGANLAAANLAAANLAVANLSHADVTHSYLWSTIFKETQLHNTYFTRAKLGNTLFINVDLSQAIGLDTIVSESDFSSNINLQSLYLSQGKLPKVFLEACGISYELIQALPNLFSIQPEGQYIEVIKEVPQNIELIKEVTKVEVQYVEVPAQQPTPTIDPQEIEFQKELLVILRSRHQELLKSKALFGPGHVPQHITIEIKEIRRDIAERKAYLRGHGVELKDHYDDHDY